MPKKKAKRRRKTLGRLPSEIQTGVRDALRTAFAVMDTVDQMPLDELVQVVRVGRKVVGANVNGKPPKVSDDILVPLWCRWRRKNPGHTVSAICRGVHETLDRRYSIELSAARIEKRIRKYLTRRGEWNGGAGPKGG